MRKGYIASIKDRKTDKDVLPEYKNLEVDFDLDLIIERGLGLLYHNDGEEVIEISEILGTEPGMIGFKIYAEDNIYDIRFLD